MPVTPMSLTTGSSEKGAGPPLAIQAHLAVTVLLSAGSSAVKCGNNIGELCAEASYISLTAQRFLRVLTF